MYQHCILTNKRCLLVSEEKGSIIECTCLNTAVNFLYDDFLLSFCSLLFVFSSFLQAMLTFSSIYYCKKQTDASFLSPTARGSTTLWQCYDVVLSSIRGQTIKNWRQFVKLMAWKNCEYHQVWLLQAILIFCLNDKNSKLIHLHT